jgi:hypothetical protein
MTLLLVSSGISHIEGKIMIWALPYYRPTTAGEFPMQKRQSGVSVAVGGGTSRDQSTLMTVGMNIVKGLNAWHGSPNIVSAK